MSNKNKKDNVGGKTATEKEGKAVGPIEAFHTFDELARKTGDLAVKGIVDGPEGLSVITQVASDVQGTCRTLYAVPVIGTGLLAMWEVIIRNPDGSHTVSVSPIIIPRAELLYSGNTTKIVRSGG